jgi:hypothetical protein
MQSNVTVPKSRAARSFLLVFLFMQAMAIVFPFVAERAPILRALSEAGATHALDYSYTARGEDADIVVFGDSSALYGADMSELSRLLGMNAINLPSSITTLALTHDRSLERYLQHNKAPKLIVLHLAPWNLDGVSNGKAPDGVFEGEEQVIRNGTLHDFTQLVRERPVDMLRFPFRFYLLLSRINLLWNHRYVPQRVTKGHIVFSEAFGHQSPDCRFPNRFLSPVGTASVEQFIGKYSTPQTKVLVYLAPLPACTNLSAVQGLTSRSTMQFEPSIVLPPDMFANDGYSVHSLKAGSEVRTQVLADRIRKALAQ